MSKNNRPLYTNQYANRDEQLRKAKGNPNKNNHSGKKNSNYGGYTAANYVADRVRSKVAKQERVTIPKGLRIGLTILLVVIVMMLILRLVVFKESQLVSYLTTLLLGVTCVVLFYVRKNYHQQKTGMFKAIQVFLSLVAVIYVAMGIIGLLSYAGIL